MTEGPACPECATTVEPTWDWCHACGFDPAGHRTEGVLTGASSPRPAPAPAPLTRASFGPSDPGPGAPLGTPGWETSWTPPAPAKRPRHVLGPVLIVLGGLVVLGVAGIFLVGPRLAKSAAATKSGAGAKDPVSYTAPDGSFSALLAGEPRVEELPQSDGTTLTMWGWDGGPNGQFVGWAPMPAGYDPALEPQMLRAFVDATVTGNGTSLPASIAGHNGLKFEGSFGGIEAQGIVFLDRGRLYILLAAGPWARQEPQAGDFLRSVTLTPVP